MIPQVIRDRPTTWLQPALHPQRRTLCRHAFNYVGECEEPPGSNRGPVVEAVQGKAGGVPGDPWCAHLMWVLLTECGVATGPGTGLPSRGAAGSCDAWMAAAKKGGRWINKAGLDLVQPGDLVVYGVPGDARHIGLLVRTAPLLYAVEGNTSTGGGYEREGCIVDAKGVDMARVLGFIRTIG